MYKKKTVLYVGLGILTVGFVLVSGYRYLTRGVCVQIKNTSDTVLSNIELIYTGGNERVGELRPKATYKVFVNPKSESHLNLSWMDPTGLNHFDRIDVYIEPDYMGDVSITINPDYRISWVDNIKSAPLGKL